MEALIIILVIIIIALVIFCLKISNESKIKEQIVIEVYSMAEDGSICQGKLRCYAQIKGTEIFATGDTFYDAVGELVNSNREIFRVEYLGKIPENKNKT